MVCGLLASPIVAARADQGVSIDLGSIAVDQQLSPGGRYRLPTMTVTNIGDTAGDYEVAIIYMNGTDARRPPADWFDLEPNRFHLEPKQSEHVQMHIDLPAGADAGSYKALIEAHPLLGGSGVRVAAAAASKVSFEVRPATLWQGWLLEIKRSFADHAPWSYLMPIALLAVVALYVSRRFVRVRLKVERTR
jgi:hypothetical protein